MGGTPPRIICVEEMVSPVARTTNCLEYSNQIPFFG
jgi:hypothetical protein